MSGPKLFLSHLPRILLVGALVSLCLLGSLSTTLADHARPNGWSTVQSLGTSLIDMTFVDAQTGWAVGTAGTVLKTTDRGETWVTQSSGTTQALRNVFFLDHQTGWVVGDGGTVLRTTDGGSSWDASVSEVSTTIRAVFFEDARNGLVLDANGIPSRTSDGGATWITATGAWHGLAPRCYVP